MDIKNAIIPMKRQNKDTKTRLIEPEIVKGKKTFPRYRHYFSYSIDMSHFVTGYDEPKDIEPEYKRIYE